MLLVDVLIIGYVSWPVNRHLGYFLLPDLACNKKLPTMMKGGEVMDTLGSRIKALREAKGITQKELGRLVGGYSRQAVGMWERDEREPDNGTLVKIANILGTTVSYLLLGRQEKTRLQMVREEAGLSQEELANRSGVPLQIISRCEAGEDVLQGLNLVKVATALNTSASYLAGNSNDRAIKNQLPPGLEQLVEDILAGRVSVDDIHRGLRMLAIARGDDRGGETNR